jgi:hypothetical protein
MEIKVTVGLEDTWSSWYLTFTAAAEVPSPPDRGGIDELTIELMSVWPACSPAPVPFGPRMRAYWEWRIDREISRGGKLYDAILDRLIANSH